MEIINFYGLKKEIVKFSESIIHKAIDKQNESILSMLKIKGKDYVIEYLEKSINEELL